ncbi:ABC transporter substrate-binding protein [Paenarthrobacter sp. DKR-5]|uniref:ABC transporter substrate-binding protein n=1 Tax=Paenarthrobacter sp. DKR-5 TaxID=2835535 RepID=UPI001BDDC644|nr:ABC transporter substrate-binding protein [Paenarthrobacter sp. DKR-5]MBT1003946.1 ABC transporter substrate-binding protein [Paenarthrobacter sp. DKR-5]
MIALQAWMRQDLSVTSAVSLVLPGTLILRGPPSGTLSIGLLVPLSGVMGIAGPSILNFALLAAEHVAERVGKVPELVVIDAGRGPDEVAALVGQLVSAGLVHGLVGAHTSDVRAAVARVVADRVPYVFTPPRERDSMRSGTIFTGSDPRMQLQRPLEWIIAHHRVRRWALIGNEYVWPRQVHRVASKVLRDLGQSVVMDRLVPLGSVDTERLLDEAGKSRAEAILLSLVGRDGINFHRQATEAGTGQRFIRLYTTFDENCLLAAGGDETGLLYSAMPSFIGQQDERHERLMELYRDRFGVSAPLPASYAEGCYDGIMLLAELQLSGLLGSMPPPVAARRVAAAGSLGGAAYAGSAVRSQLAVAEGHELLVIGNSAA